MEYDFGAMSQVVLGARKQLWLPPPVVAVSASNWTKDASHLAEVAEWEEGDLVLVAKN